MYTKICNHWKHCNVAKVSANIDWNLFEILQNFDPTKVLIKNFECWNCTFATNREWSTEIVNIDMMGTKWSNKTQTTEKTHEKQNRKKRKQNVQL